MVLWLGAAAGIVALAVHSRDEQVAATVDQLDSLVGTEGAIVSPRLMGDGRRAEAEEAADCSEEYIPGTICSREEDRRRLGLPDPAPLGPVTQSTLADPPPTPFIAPDEGPVEANPTAQIEQTITLEVTREDEPPPTTSTTQAPTTSTTQAPTTSTTEAPGTTSTTATTGTTATGGVDESAGGAAVAGRTQGPGGGQGPGADGSGGGGGPLPRTGGGWLALTAVGLALVAVGLALDRARRRKFSSPA
jgi:LPXTG-motif cell wall-anchored protein